MTPHAAQAVRLVCALITAADVAQAAVSEAWVVDPFVVLPAPASRGVAAGDLMPYRVDLPTTVVPGPDPAPVRVKGHLVDQGVVLTPHLVGAFEAAEGGARAWWELFAYCEPMARKAVQRAHGRRVAELSDATGRPPTPLLDEIALESVVDQMMTGRGGSFERMTRLVLSPTRFQRVSPARWLATTIYREAWQQVGKAVGDVRPGPRIRLMASKMHGSTHAQVASAFNATVTASNRITPDLVERALSLRWHPNLPSGSAALKVVLDRDADPAGRFQVPGEAL